LADAERVLRGALVTLESVDLFERDALEPAFRALAESLGLSTGVVFGAIRVAITGRTAAPPLFDTMEVLGRERVEQRLRRALELVESMAANV
jgi:glutamyl-tRNA synthetase